MTELQKQKQEVKKLSHTLDMEYAKLQKRVTLYDREPRQLKKLQQNITNIQNLAEELLVSIEKIRLRGDF